MRFFFLPRFSVLRVVSRHGMAAEAILLWLHGIDWVLCVVFFFSSPSAGSRPFCFFGWRLDFLHGSGAWRVDSAQQWANSKARLDARMRMWSGGRRRQQTASGPWWVEARLGWCVCIGCVGEEGVHGFEKQTRHVGEATPSTQACCIHGCLSNYLASHAQNPTESPWLDVRA